MSNMVGGDSTEQLTAVGILLGSIYVNMVFLKYFSNICHFLLNVFLFHFTHFLFSSSLPFKEN